MIINETVIHVIIIKTNTYDTRHWHYYLPFDPRTAESSPPWTSSETSLRMTPVRTVPIIFWRQVPASTCPEWKTLDSSRMYSLVIMTFDLKDKQITLNRTFVYLIVGLANVSKLQKKQYLNKFGKWASQLDGLILNLLNFPQFNKFLDDLVTQVIYLHNMLCRFLEICSIQSNYLRQNRCLTLDQYEK